MAGPVALEARNVRVPGILSALSLAVAPGEMLALVGPNGAGKSTLLSVLCGRRRPASGRVLLDGHDLTRLDGLRRARVLAHVPQHDDPDPRFVVRDYVALGRLPHAGSARRDEDRDAVARAMAVCRVDRFASLPIGRLSGGELQRVRLARAVAQDAAVLLLDEPTNHLDLAGRIEFLGLLAGLRRTVVAVLHDLVLADRFADRVAVLEAGRLVGHGLPGHCLEPAAVEAVFGVACRRVVLEDGIGHLVFPSGTGR
ncbi:MAG: ABC transporter ATP-binding protein [Gluconacetobacter diazotrophicus]|nr:ABC transporter ATP-binding protein [Gluconacetobacter diazotrophicus]